MERLTEVTIEDGVKLYDISSELCLSRTTQGEKIATILKKLADYEDLEEQGRLIKLPCDKAYYIVDKNNPRFAMVNCKSITDLTLYEINEIDIGGIYFSTEELAEAKLKELRGGEDESNN